MEVARVGEQLRALCAPAPGAASEDGDAVLRAALDELEVYVVDRTVLSRTQIGAEVSKLRKHEDPNIAERARTLLAQWKRDDEVRRKAIDGFQKFGLKARDAKQLEVGLFNTAAPLGLMEGDEYRSYQRHYKRICTHLRGCGEGTLKQRIEEGHVAAAQVAALPDDELLTSQRKRQRLEEEQEGLRNALGGTTEPTGTVTEAYRCPKCSSSRTAYKDVQTGWHNDQQDMTILVLCLECGERWKEGDDHGLAG